MQITTDARLISLCLRVYAYSRKELEMMTVCYYNTGIFLVQTEEMKRKRNA
jgi:hypothetical protein